MRRTALPLLALSVLGSLGLQARAQDAPATGFEWRADHWVRVVDGQAYRVLPNEVTVRFLAPVADLDGFRAALGSAAAGFDGLSTLRSNRLGIHDLALPSGSDPLDVVARLRATGRVEFAEVATQGVYTGGTPNDPQFGAQWHWNNTGQSGGTPGADVKALTGWDLEDGDPSIVVAVLDSGTEWTHPDLAAAMWANPGELPGNGVDDDGNGYVDDVVGWNFSDNTNDPSSNYFHGTATASVVGAIGDNGIGIVGLAGGARDGQGCRILACEVGEFGPVSSVIDDAVLYATDNGAKVITFSFGIPSSTSVTAAIQAAVAAGVFVNCSAGNFGSISYPASLPEVFCVGGTNHNDQGSGFSSGPQMDVAAPSSDITMCDLGGGYTTSSGTSFGSPMVAGLAALILSVDPSLSNTEVGDLIRNHAQDVLTPGFDNTTGSGRIDVAATLAAVDVTVTAFGTGTPSAQGLVPEIGWAGGGAVVGNGQFRLELDTVRPGSLAFLAVGLGTTPASTPFAGGTVYVDLAGPVLVDVRTANGAGHAEYAYPIPGDPSLQGANFTAQWAVVDPVVGFALSSAAVATIGG